MKKQEVRALIEEIGIVPVIRGGLRRRRDLLRRPSAGWNSIVEITMTVPGALEVIPNW